MNTRIPATLLLIGLAACGTPQERCINAGTRDLRTLDRLIAESEANLARGYGYENIEVTHSRWVVCDYEPAGAPAQPGAPAPRPQPRYCLDDVTETERRPVSIDLGAETAKLQSMKRKRADLGKAATATINACKAQYPA